MKHNVLRSAALALVCLLGAISGLAQTAGYTVVSGSHLHDATGTLISSATIKFQPVNNAGVPISFRAGGTGGQSIAFPVSTVVTNGVFSIQLADTTLTAPLNVCYAVTLISNLTGREIPFPGYNCIQPSGSSWSFDTYTPNLPGLVVQQAGIPGTNANLVPDPNFANGFADWSQPGGWTIINGTPFPALNSLVVPASDSGTFSSSGSPLFFLTVGQTYVLSGYINATSMTSGPGPIWALENPTLTIQYEAITQVAGTAGSVVQTFTFAPAGVATGTLLPVTLIFDVRTSVFAGTLSASNPSVELAVSGLAGAVGPTGPAGPQGPTGPTGPIGATGVSMRTLSWTFTGPGTHVFTHGLGSLYPLFTTYVLSGAPPSSVSVIDNNNISVTVLAASSMVVSFAATNAIAGSYGLVVTPTSISHVIASTGTQTATFTVTQTGSSGYTGVVNYSVSGLPSGVTAAFSATSITGSGTTTLTLSFPSTQAEGLSTITLTASDGVTTLQTSLSLQLWSLLSGLQNLWAMEDGPTAMADQGGSAANLTASGVTTGSITGLGPTAAIFSGAGFATAANDTNTNFLTTQPFSVSLWTTFSASGAEDCLISTLNSAAGFQGWDIERNASNKLEFIIFNTSTTGITSLSPGTYPASPNLLHIVMTYTGSGNSSGVTMYVNGVAIAATVAGSVTGSIASGLPVTIGARPDHTVPHNGAIGYVRIYNRVLSAAEVAVFYAQGAE